MATLVKVVVGSTCPPLWRFTMKKAIFFVLLLTAVTRQAQTTERIYILPLVLDAFDARVPKYIHDASLDYSLIDAGKRNLCLVNTDIPDASHVLLAAQSDVLSVPQNLDNNLSAAAVTIVKNKLDAMNVPNGWVNTNLTYRQVLRVVAGIFLLAQRFETITGGDLFNALDQDTILRDIPARIRLNLLSAAQIRGVDDVNWDLDWTFRRAIQESGLRYKQMIVKAGRMAY